MRKAVIAALIAAYFVAGCSKPQDVVIPSDPTAWQGDFAKQIKDLSESDKGLLTAYLIRKKMGETFGGVKIPIGVTVGQALEDQRTWLTQKQTEEAEQAKLKQQIEDQKKAAADELGKTVILAFLNEQYVPENYREGLYENQLQISIGIKNKGSKNIKGVKADMVFKNTFGENISTTTLNIEQSIPAGGQVTWQGSRKLNRFDDEDKKLMNLSPGAFSTDIHPTMVVYEDGTTVGAP